MSDITDPGYRADQSKISRLERGLDHALKELADDHDRLQELVLKHIPNANVTGDSYGVPGILDLADMLANRLVEAEAALKESKSRIRLLGETLAEHVSEEFMEAHGLDWENWSSNNSVCTAPPFGQPNPEPPYGEGGEEKP